MGDMTTRLGLPLLSAGQAQKEAFHNEALTALDLLVQPSVVTTTRSTPPAEPKGGEAWIVAAGADGAWTGREDQLAGWTEGGWRFAAPILGMAIWVEDAGVIARWSGRAWRLGEITGRTLVLDGEQMVGSRQPAIAPPTGGDIRDMEARGAIDAILAALRNHGLIRE